MASIDAEIVNKLGLHARAAAKFTHVASGFQSEIWLSRSGRRVNAKSIMGVMMLAAGKGSTVTIEANGRRFTLTRSVAETVAVRADPAPPPRTALPEQLVLAKERYGR